MLYNSLIRGKQLYAQINTLNSIVSKHKRGALRGVWLIGNVSAHMKASGVIAEQDALITLQDAEKLLKLLEYLNKSWFVDEEDAKVLMAGVA
jgi:hypothetical protein